MAFHEASAKEPDASIDGLGLIAFLLSGIGSCAASPTPRVRVPDLPDRLVVEAYQRAAVQNVLASVNPKVFPGYWCVCADGRGFGYDNSYPSLDGHQ